MDHPSFHQGGSIQRIPTSFSIGSLDGLFKLANDNFLQSLLSESVTLDSLSSKSTDALPPFPLCQLSNNVMIGLGEGLEFFSATLPWSKQGSGGESLNSTVMISSPTSPRLKSMLKECLSIRQWAESSSGWQAPGHTPWSSIQEKPTTSWIPEGSVFPPEFVSLALRTARTHGDTDHLRSLLISSTPSGSAMHGMSGELHNDIDAEIVDMMNELRGITSFFQDLPREDDTRSGQPGKQTEKLSVPSLVVSDSHCTFPLPMESSQSLSRSNTRTLARRRGKQTPTPLFTGKQTKLPDLAYPDIPTAFLGSPSRHLPSFDDISSNDTSTLRFEEMINNLRLQCSTMELQSPSTDTAWNSRSPPQTPGTSQAASVLRVKPRAVCNNGAFAKAPGADRANHLPVSTVLPSTKPPVAQRRPYQRKPVIPRQPLLGAQPSACKVAPKLPKVDPVDIRPKPSDLRKCEKVTHVPKVESSPPSQLLRSAIIKNPSCQPKQPPKTVRFFLAHQDLENDDICPMPRSCSAEYILSSANISEKCTPPSNTKALGDLSPALGTARKFSLERSSTLTHKPSWKALSQVAKPSLSAQSKARSHSVTVGSPLRHSTVLPNAHIATEVDGECSNLTSSRRSTQSLGRHSLSRIIKHPMFSGRDSKRATVSFTEPEFHGVDENATRRASQTPSSLQKKSRMPVPLRNILTRFK